MRQTRVKCPNKGCPNKVLPPAAPCGPCAGSSKTAAPSAAPPPRGVNRFEDNGNTAIVYANVDREVRTLEELIEICKIDTSVWNVDRHVIETWPTTMKPAAVGSSGNWRRDDARPVQVVNFLVKAYLSRKSEVIAARNEIAELKAEALRLAEYRPAIVHEPTDGELMLEVAIPDTHVGKLAWSEETGHGNYDTKIAVGGYHVAVDKLLSRVRGHRFTKILLPIGNDLLNADNREGLTTRGTQQQGDGRYQKTFRIVRRMIEETIEKLRLLAPVDVIVVPGNHDTLAAWHLGDSLECLYRNVPDVSIDNSANLRKFVQFGKVMLMFCHGDKGKKIDYPLLMARERKEMWATSEHREIHIGHTHESKVAERLGVKTRVSPALCPPDAWHAENMFVGNARGAEAYVWHREEGLINLAVWTVPEGK
jgi:hypothetical protein